MAWPCRLFPHNFFFGIRTEFPTFRRGQQLHDRAAFFPRKKILLKFGPSVRSTGPTGLGPDRTKDRIWQKSRPKRTCPVRSWTENCTPYQIGYWMNSNCLTTYIKSPGGLWNLKHSASSSVGSSTTCFNLWPLILYLPIGKYVSNNKRSSSRI